MRHVFVVKDNQNTTYNGVLTTISQYLSSPSGLRRLAQSMALPISRRLNYQGLARKVFAIDPLPEISGLVWYSDNRREVAKCHQHQVIIRGGETRLKYKKTVVPANTPIIFPNIGPVIFPTFQLVNNPTVHLMDIKQRRFSLIDRMGFKKTTYHNHISIDNRNNVGKHRELNRQRVIHNAKLQIMQQEDEAVFRALDDIIKNGF